MEQITLPMRIALGVVLAFAALWFVALRPKPVEDVAVESEPAPVVTGAPDAARAAVDGANATSAARERAAEATGEGGAAAGREGTAQPRAAADARPAAEGSTAKAQSTPATKPAEKRLEGGERVLADLEDGKAVVLLFWNGTGADDRAVRRAVSQVDRRDGKVSVRVARLSDLASYEQLTRGVPVTTSPTVLVIDRLKRARAIRGLTVTAELDDAAGRALAGK